MSVSSKNQFLLTDAELFCLSHIANSSQGANWYQLGRLLTPSEYPNQDINPSHILTHLEQSGFIKQLPQTTKLEMFIATVQGSNRTNIQRV